MEEVTMNIELTQRQLKFVKKLLKKEFNMQETRYREIKRELNYHFVENSEEKQDKCIENLAMLTPIICQLEK